MILASARAETRAGCYRYHVMGRLCTPSGGRQSSLPRQVFTSAPSRHIRASFALFALIGRERQPLRQIRQVGTRHVGGGCHPWPGTETAECGSSGARASKGNLALQENLALQANLASRENLATKILGP